MAWGTTGRQLPPDWKRRVAAIKTRDHGRCQATRADGTQCTAPGTEVDHIDDPNNHALANLQLLCHWHHARKTAGQSHNAQAARRAAARQATRDSHPGLTTPRVPPPSG